MNKSEPLLCYTCDEKESPAIRTSKHMVPEREHPYDLGPDELTINKNVIGVCGDCLADKSLWQQGRKMDVDVGHPFLVYTLGQQKYNN